VRLVVYTFTRDRLDYTKRCFASLQEKAGTSFDHVVVDNGSVDGTVSWVESKYKPTALIQLPHNYGIHRATNLVHDFIASKPYDLAVKFDNDCLVLSENILGQLSEIFQAVGDARFGPRYVLSPRVEGINRQPRRLSATQLAGRRIGLTGILGGLFRVAPIDILTAFRADETLPKARGVDAAFADWALKQGCLLGYVEGLKVEHIETTDGQAKRYPEYFERKHREEK